MTVSVMNKNVYHVDVNAISVQRKETDEELFSCVWKLKFDEKRAYGIFAARHRYILPYSPFRVSLDRLPFQFRFRFCFSVHAVEEKRKLGGTTVRKESIVLENGVIIDKND